MTDHQKFDATDSKAVCYQAKSSVYFYAGDEALYKVIDLRFTGYRWGLLNSWENHSGEIEKYSYETSSSLTVTKGSEADTYWKVSDEFKGLSVEIGGESKTFSSTETTTTIKQTWTGSAKPNASVYLYQKIYSFDWEVWFILDAWCKEWTVGNWKSSGYYRMTGSTEIALPEFLSKSSKLSGTTTKPCTAKKDVDTPDRRTTKQFQDCTTKCQDKLKT